jgi:hypothetical protein
MKPIQNIENTVDRIFLPPLSLCFSFSPTHSFPPLSLSIYIYKTKLETSMLLKLFPNEIVYVDIFCEEKKT